jgi:hypothetical protein
MPRPTEQPEINNVTDRAGADNCPAGEGVRYVNCGDWVESCTAVAEHDDGRFEILTWIEIARRPQQQPVRAAARAA